MAVCDLEDEFLDVVHSLFVHSLARWVKMRLYRKSVARCVTDVHAERDNRRVRDSSQGQIRSGRGYGSISDTLLEVTLIEGKGEMRIEAVVAS